MNWTRVINELHVIGFPSNFLIQLNVIPSEKDHDLYSGTYILELSPPKTIMTREKLDHIRMKEEVERYKIYIAKVIKELSDMPYNTFIKDINNIVDFEIKLARLVRHCLREFRLKNKINLCFSQSDLGDQKYQNFTLRDLNTHFKFLNWTRYISLYLPDGASLNDQEKVLVPDEKFLSNLETLLSTTDDTVLNNYLLWRVIDFSNQFLNEYLRKLHNEYHVKQDLSCVELVRTETPIIASAMYAHTYLNNRNKDELRDQVVDDVEGILDFTMGLLTWLDEKSRDAARKRLKETIRFITVPPELSKDFINNFYSKLTAINLPLLNQVLNIRQYEEERKFQKLKHPINKHEWIRFGDLVNVLKYKPSERYILSIPTPLIEEQLTHINTSVVDYATVGVLVARDYIYRFMGLYNPVGTTFKSHGSWWTNDSLIDFKPHMQCFIEKYGEFKTPDGIKLRSNYLKYENIVDVGALRAAHTAFKYLGDTAEERLPGIQYNEAKQIFWTKAAQNWCSKYIPDEIKRELLKGHEVPGKFRVNGALKNLRDFGKDFGCNAGAPMFPDKNSCYGLWDTEKQFY